MARTAAAVLLAVVLLLRDPTASSGPSSTSHASPPAVPYRFERTSDDRSWPALDRWSSAVGLPIVELNAAADVEVTDPVVISWNLHGANGDLSELVARLQDGRLLGRPARDMVLMLQEVVRTDPGIPPVPELWARMASPLPRGSRPLPDLRATAQRVGLNLAYVPSMRNGRLQEDRGNAVLTNLPLTEVVALELPLGRQRRVAVSVIVRSPSPERPLWRFTSVHFDTGLLIARGGPARWREHQARALVDALAARSLPTIVGGDLNTWWGSDEPAVRQLRRAYPEAGDRRPRTSTWRGPMGATNKLDHLFAAGWGERMLVDRIGNRFGSDHWPIYTWLPNGTTRQLDPMP